MKHSLNILVNELVAAEKSAALYSRYADDSDRAAKQATELAVEQRNRAAADKARADDIRAAIDALEAVNQPKEQWGIFYNHEGATYRSADFPGTYDSEAQAKNAISHLTLDGFTTDRYVAKLTD